tara:strand:- start:761 stop:1006 length:246 start_codon:yes stop_codon:yes gene_type:complete
MEFLRLTKAKVILSIVIFVILEIIGYLANNITNPGCALSVDAGPCEPYFKVSSFITFSIVSIFISYLFGSFLVYLISKLKN